MRFNFSETEPVECACIFFATDLNSYKILIAELVDIEDFCREPGHLCMLSESDF